MSVVLVSSCTDGKLVGQGGSPVCNVCRGSVRGSEGRLARRPRFVCGERHLGIIRHLVHNIAEGANGCFASGPPQAPAKLAR
jgi:hypothetical protein